MDDSAALEVITSVPAAQVRDTLILPPPLLLGLNRSPASNLLHCAYGLHRAEGLHRILGCAGVWRMQPFTCCGL